MKRSFLLRNNAFGLLFPVLCLFCFTVPVKAEPIKDPYHPYVNDSPITLMKDNMLSQSLGGRLADLDVWVGEFIKFDDNIFNTAHNKKNDVIYSTAAGFKMEAEQKDTWKLRLEGQIQYNAYGKHNEYDGLEGYFRSMGSVRFSPALSARISMNYDNTYDNIRDVEDIYSLHRYSVGTGVTVKPSPYFGTDIDYVYFGQRRDVSSLDYQNYDEHTVSVRPFYEITSNTTLYMQVSGSYIDPTKSDPRYNPSQGVTAVLGAAWKYMDSAALYAEVGYKYMHFDDSDGTVKGDNNMSRPVFQIGGDYVLNSDWKAGASVSYSTMYGGVTSNASNSKSIERTSVTAFLAYSPGEGRFTAKITPYFTDTDPSMDDDYREYGVHFGAAYSFTDWINMSIGYRYSVTDYNNRSSYNRNIFTVGLAAAF